MSTPSKKWYLKSSDGVTFEVDVEVASVSLTMKHLIEDIKRENSTPLPLVNAHTLSKVIEYCKKHVKPPSDADSKLKQELKKFDTEFIKLDWTDLLDLSKAANYLNIPGLLDIICREIANKIKHMQPAEFRGVFNIENDFSGQEENQLMRENAWAYRN